MHCRSEKTNKRLVTISRENLADDTSVLTTDFVSPIALLMPIFTIQKQYGHFHWQIHSPLDGTGLNSEITHLIVRMLESACSGIHFQIHFLTFRVGGLTSKFDRTSNLIRRCRRCRRLPVRLGLGTSDSDTPRL